MDFSACSLDALNYAVKLGTCCRADLILLHVAEPLHPGSMLEGAEIRRLHNLAVQQANHRLAEITRNLPQPHPPARYLVRKGSPFSVIVTMARKTAADLIVIGTHGHTGFPAVLIGSTAERVARRAHCPVLMVRAPPQS